MPSPVSKNPKKFECSKVDLKSFIGIFGAFDDVNIFQLLFIFKKFNLDYTMEDVEDEISCCKYYTYDEKTRIINNTLIKFNSKFTYKKFIIKLNEHNIWFY